MNWLDKFIVSERGQWDYPGYPTAVPTKNGRITMEGVPYPVMGFVPGQPPVMMQPGKNYKFPGKTVYEIPIAQKGLQTSSDSLAHQLNKIADYEYSRGSASGTGLSNFGNPALGNNPTKQQAVNWMMQNTVPIVNPYFTSPTEQAEATDFVYNTGRDPRVYMLDQYLKSIGQSGLQNRGSYNIDINDPVNAAKWKTKKAELDKIWNEHSGNISKLSENDRRVLLNKGRDFYYRNINVKPDGSPSDAYYNTWYGRIWNTNDYAPFDRNNPKFIAPRKKEGGHIVPGRYRNPEGNWLNKYANGGDISIPNLSRGWLDKYQDGSEVPANLPWINSQGQYQEPVKTSKALSDDDLRRVDISEVSETTDTPAVRLAQKVAVQQREDWQNRKPIAKKPVSKKQNYNAKIAAYSRAEDNKIIDTYYKKYDESNEDQVKAIQAELVAKNFLPGPAAVDGKFGDKTKEAYLKYKTAERVGDLSGETEKSTCSYDGCAEYVSSVTRPYGWVLGDAWTMKNNIETNGGTVKYNIYTDPRFSRVKSKDQLKNVTEAVKRNNKATADMFQVGDVVGLYYKGSNMHQTALKDGRGTYNTHVGVVTEIKDGKPVISHNIHGKLHHDPYDNLTIGWVGTPAPRMAKYKPSKQPETLKDKINIYSKELTEILAPGVDSEKIANNIKGILRKETGLGKLKPTDADIEEIKARRDFLGESADIKDISRGIGKLKTATIPDDMKYFLGINDENIDDDAGVKAAVYKYVDAYNQFKAYSQNNPQLNLTDEDLHQMSILAYNQGTDKLMNLGYNNPTMPISSEVDALRDLYSGNIRDISSTNFKYLPSIDTYVGGIPINIDPGQALYDSRYPEGHESYISRVNKYANTPIEELEASVPKRKEKLRPVFKKLGGWLDKYQSDDTQGQIRRDPNQLFFESQTEPDTYESQYSQPEVTITPDWTEAELERNRLRDEYIKKDKNVFRHWYDKLGYDKDNVTKRANQFAYNKLAKQYLKGDKEKLTPEQRKFIEKSEYADRLQPSVGSRFAEGVTNPGFNLETLSNLAAPLEYPTNLVRGAVKGEFEEALKGETPSPYFVSSDLAGTSPNEAAIASGLIDAGVDIGVAAATPTKLPGSANNMGPGPMMLGLSKYPHEVKNVDYFKKMLDSYSTNKLSNQSKKYFEGIINSVKKQDGLATKKQYDMLQRLRTGDFNYGKKGAVDSDPDDMDWLQEEIRFTTLPELNNPEASEVLDNFMTRIKTPEGKRRLKELGITEKEKYVFDKLKIVNDENTLGHYWHNKIGLNPNLPEFKNVTRHEIEHSVQDAYNRARLNDAFKFKWTDLLGKTKKSQRLSEAAKEITTDIDESLKGLELRKTPQEVDWNALKERPTKRDPSQFFNYLSNKQAATNYFASGSGGKEKSAFLAEVQQYMMDQGIIPSKSYVEVTPEMVKNTFVDAMFDETGGGKYLRLFNIMKPTETNYKLLADGLNKMLGIAPAIGLGTAAALQKEKDGGWLDRYQGDKQQSQVTPPANLPWINNQGQYAKPNSMRVQSKVNKTLREMTPEELDSYKAPDATWENVAEVLDPTGLFSHDDAKRAYDSWQASGRMAPTLQEELDMFSAVPGLGKFGKYAYASYAHEFAKPVIKSIPWQQIVNLFGTEELYGPTNQEHETEQKKKKLGGWLEKYQDGSQVPQSWKDKYDWTPNVEEEYQKFKNDPNAPENLRFTDDMKDYNTRGMWDSLDRPSNWQQALELFKQQQGYEWTPEEDGYYHAWSQHPGTGEWLKPRHHSTGWMNYMGYAFDPENTVVVNPEGFFGNETLQAYPKEKKKAGGMSPSMGYFNYIGGYRGMLP